MDAMKILSAAEMQACDRATTERYGVPSLDLVRAAVAGAWYTAALIAGLNVWLLIETAMG